MAYDAPGQESTYHETQLALQIGYLDFLYEFYGMATGVRTAPIGFVGNSKDLYQKNERFSELAWEVSFVAQKRRNRCRTPDKIARLEQAKKVIKHGT